MKVYKLILLAIYVIPIMTYAQRPAKESWTSLVNGKDLKGWKTLEGKAPFRVEGTEVIGTAVLNEPTSFLVTEQSYGDFILELEFKTVPALNSGILFRAESKPEYQNSRVHGYEFEIDPSPRAWTGGIHDEGRRGWLYQLDYNPAGKTAYKQNEWNKLRIESIGNSLRTWVNNIPTAHLIDDLSPKGFIALQLHSIRDAKDAGSESRWRNIRIQTENLKPSPPDNIFVVNFVPNSISDQEKVNGVRLLWDGKTTQGWRGARKEIFPTKGWYIKDGTLNVEENGGAESQNGGDIVTIDEFVAFDLSFEFKLTAGANSGVKYFVTEEEISNGSAIGLEYQILDDATHPDAKLGAAGNRTLASLYDLIPSEKNPRFIHKIGEWNLGRVVVYPDNRVEHWLNGIKVVEYKRGSPIFQVLVARSKYAQWEKFGIAPQGHILLQDHGNTVTYRSIKIKELK